jgi:hypothetical protein
MRGTSSTVWHKLFPYSPDSLTSLESSGVLRRDFVANSNVAHAGSFFILLRCGLLLLTGSRIPDPAFTRLFQLRIEEGRDYKERVQ